LKEKTEFSFWEIVFFLINSISVKTLLVHPMLINKYGGSAAILMALYISIIGFLFVSLILLLYKKFEYINFADIIKNRLGNTIFLFVFFLFFLFFIINTGLALRNVCENIKFTIFKDSPIMLVFIFVFTAMCSGAFLGFKALIRLHAIFVPILLTLFITIFFSVVNSYNINNVFPLFGNGLPILYYGFIFSSYFTDIIAILFFAENINTDVSISKACFTAYTISSVILIITVSIYVLILPYPVNTEFFMPLYQLERYLEQATILSRLEAFFSPMWFISFFLYLSSTLSIACKIFCVIFNKKNYNKAIIPLGFLCATIGMCPQSSLIVLNMTETNTYIRMSIGFFITLLLLLTARFRRENF